MKKVNIESGRPVIYVDDKDIDVLVRIGQLGGDVLDSVFDEETIQARQLDENGRYRINDLQNVNYIKCLPYIVHENFLEKLSDRELSECIWSGNQVFETVKVILRQHCFNPAPFTPEEIELLNSVDCVEKDLITQILDSDFTTIEGRARGSNLSICVIAQVGNYVESYQRELDERERIKEEAKSEQKLIKRISRKLPFTKRGK